MMAGWQVTWEVRYITQEHAVCVADVGMSAPAARCGAAPTLQNILRSSLQVRMMPGRSSMFSASCAVPRACQPPQHACLSQSQHSHSRGGKPQGTLHQRTTPTGSPAHQAGHARARAHTHTQKQVITQEHTATARTTINHTIYTQTKQTPSTASASMVQTPLSLSPPPHQLLQEQLLLAARITQLDTMGAQALVHAPLTGLHAPAELVHVSAARRRQDDVVPGHGKGRGRINMAVWQCVS